MLENTQIQQATGVLGPRFPNISVSSSFYVNWGQSYDQKQVQTTQTIAGQSLLMVGIEKNNAFLPELSLVKLAIVGWLPKMLEIQICHKFFCNFFVKWGSMGECLRGIIEQKK